MIVTLVLETVTVLLIITTLTAHFIGTDAMLLLLIFSARRSRMPAARACSICSHELPTRIASMAAPGHLLHLRLELLVVHDNLLMLWLVIVKLVMVMALANVSCEALFEVRRS